VDPPVEVLRVLDAAANRAAEGLRVIEDFVRFALDDRNLTEQLKDLRHDLAALMAPLAPERYQARDTLADVGTAVSTAAEQSRAAPQDVCHASFARVQQALRSIEEFGKLLTGDMGSAAEQLRYRAYTLHSAVLATAESCRRLGDARLYVLIDGGESATAFESLAGKLVAAGVDLLQLRDKRLDDRRLIDRARRLVALTRGSATLAIVNDRPDIARLARADGVHVGQEELSVKDVRSIVGTSILIGVSTHTRAQARQAVLDGADYIGVGPTFPSTTKTFAEFPGLEFVHQVATEISLPAFAIGGVTADNVRQVRSAGVNRVCVAAAVTASDDPEAAVRRLKDLLNR